MHLLSRIERLLRRDDIPPSRLGREALGDPRLVGDLRRGRELRPSTAARLAAYLDAREAERRR